MSARGRGHRARRAGVVFGRFPNRGCGSVVVTGRRCFLDVNATHLRVASVRVERPTTAGSGPVPRQTGRGQVGWTAACFRSRRRVPSGAWRSRRGGPWNTGSAGAGKHGTSPNVRAGIPVAWSFVPVRGTRVENRRQTFGGAAGLRYVADGWAPTNARSRIPGAAFGIVAVGQTAHAHGLRLVERGEDEDGKLERVGSTRERQANLPGRRDSEAREAGRFQRPRFASAREEAVQRYGRARKGDYPRELKTQERIGSYHPGNTGWLVARTLAWLKPLKASLQPRRVGRRMTGLRTGTKRARSRGVQQGPIRLWFRPGVAPPFTRGTWKGGRGFSNPVVRQRAGGFGRVAVPDRFPWARQDDSTTVGTGPGRSQAVRSERPVTVRGNRAPRCKRRRVRKTTRGPRAPIGSSTVKNTRRRHFPMTTKPGCLDRATGRSTRRAVNQTEGLLRRPSRRVTLQGAPGFRTHP